MRGRLETANRYPLTRQAPRQWRGRRRGATSIRSNRRSRPARSGRAPRKASAARAIRRRWRGASAAAATPRSARDLTSMIASTRPRRAMMSISPAGQRQPCATIRQPRSRRCQRHNHSASLPRRSARRRRATLRCRTRLIAFGPASAARGDRVRCAAGRSRRQALPRHRVRRARRAPHRGADRPPPHPARPAQKGRQR